jgi:hypothetical protein
MTVPHSFFGMDKTSSQLTNKNYDVISARQSVDISRTTELDYRVVFSLYPSINGSIKLRKTDGNLL